VPTYDDDWYELDLFEPISPQDPPWSEFDDESDEES
jgi:hypothetical protein